MWPASSSSGVTVRLGLRRSRATSQPASASRPKASSDPLGHVVASALSVGNRQRLNVAISLLGSPDALLLDEPTASLDPEQRARLWADLEVLPARGGAMCFVTQHDDELPRADRVLELRDGRLVA